MDKHSKLAPSSAYRWLECTASVKAIAQANIPETTSEAAEEGNRAHQLAAICLIQNEDPMTCEGDYDDDMRAHIVKYIKYVEMFKFTMMLVECKLSLFYATHNTGTADIVALQDKVLHIIDLKYGISTFVEVKDNPQLLIYAVSALKIYGEFCHVEKVVVSVYQPRMDNIASWEYSLEELKEYEKNIYTQAEITDTSAATFKPSESTCNFCPLKPQCSALDKHLTEVMNTRFHNVEKLKMPDVTKLRYVLDNKKLIVSWLNAIEKYVLTTLQTGRKLDGYKVVKGKGRRSWGSTDKLLEMLQNDAYEKTLLTPTKFEKFVAKNKDKLDSKQIEMIKHDIIRKEGKEILVPVSHKKRAIEYLEFKKYDLEEKP